jgi:predicted acetyltransferase
VVGFALLRRDIDPATGQAFMDLAEFFVVASRRREGLGREAAVALWRLFPDRWSVRVLRSNRNAYPFWKRIIADYTDGDYSEHVPQDPFGGEFMFLFRCSTGAVTRRSIDAAASGPNQEI